MGLGGEYYRDKYAQVSIVPLVSCQQLYYQVRWYRNELSYLLKARSILLCGDFARDFILIQVLLVDSFVILLVISEHPLVKAATTRVIEQKQGFAYHAFITLQKYLKSWE